MEQIANLVSFLLASVGLTVLIVWPQTGPGAWLRESVLRPALGDKAGEVLDCYVCLGFWSGLLLSPICYWLTGQYWSWAGCLMVPAVFWWALRPRGFGRHFCV